MEKRKNPIVEKSFSFSLEIISFCQLLREKKEWDLSSQLFRSGTSIGANIKEAQNAESRSDFIHKMKISAKEAEEVEYWLELCKASEFLPYQEGLIDKCIEIKKMLNSIIGTAKRNR